jgi:Cd2+/Zn2+-exporting ATPase
MQSHEHQQGAVSKWKVYVPSIISLAMLLSGLAVDFWLMLPFFSGPVRLVWYLVAYFPVAWPVITEGWKSVARGEFFTEFTLMTLATLGAFGIGQYPEGVAVMVFYAIGELFQGAAVRSAKSNIKALLDMRPSTAHVYRNNTYQIVNPHAVVVG